MKMYLTMSMVLASVAAWSLARPASQEPAPNTLTAEERAAGWQLLFDGQSLEHWRGFKRDNAPDGWRAADGTIARVGRGGDLVTRQQYASFELALDWRVSPGGNSGVMFHVTEDAGQTYHTGPEMQILDNAGHRDGQSPLTAAGSNYGLHAPPRDLTRPVGEWNTARLVVRGGRFVEHWLNGEKVVEYELGSADWTARVAASKFKEWPGYGKAGRGHIALQDHGNPVWYRNIKIR
ncbi:MAG TPA: DUF1080 domain-containing protein [Vicinamibacterales bacterium]|nr:DUF1080 domain-containing protein [Vicinamibacterales bacterium]